MRESYFATVNGESREFATEEAARKAAFVKGERTAVTTKVVDGMIVSVAIYNATTPWNELDQAYPIEGQSVSRVALAIKLMRGLTEDERLKVMREFCGSCGGDAPCWRDE